MKTTRVWSGALLLAAAAACAPAVTTTVVAPAAPAAGLAAAEATTLAPGDYDLKIDATDAGGVDSIEVLVDAISEFAGNVSGGVKQGAAFPEGPGAE